MRTSVNKLSFFIGSSPDCQVPTLGCVTTLPFLGRPTACRNSVTYLSPVAFSIAAGGHPVCAHVLSCFRCVQLFVIPWMAACQASPSFTISWALLKLMSIESVMPSNHLTLCRPLLLLLWFFPSIRVYFSESALRNRWAKYWSFSTHLFKFRVYFL